METTSNNIPSPVLRRPQFEFSDLVATAFNACDAETRTDFEIWVRSLTVELDNEPGDDPEKGTWVFVLVNNSQLRAGQPYAPSSSRTARQRI